MNRLANTNSLPVIMELNLVCKQTQVASSLQPYWVSPEMGDIFVKAPEVRMKAGSPCLLCVQLPLCLLTQ